MTAGCITSYARHKYGGQQITDIYDTHESPPRGLFYCRKKQKERNTLRKLTLGSLFDGISGFPFAASLSGIETVWTSDIEPSCEAVALHHFPNAIQLGDIKKINGAEIPPVDIISGGSPCQDLSVAGLRKGMLHSDLGHDEETRSGLFIEMIRIIKEMKYATNNEYPKYVVWENVPGALSSNKGADFQAVLEEVTSISGAKLDAVRPKKWNRAGTILGDGFSVSWRILDAQYWGVPQRRRRIFLVASLGDQSAPEILFIEEGMSGNFEPRRKEGESVARNADEGIVRSCVKCYDIGEARLRTPSEYDDCAPTLSARCGTGGNNTPAVVTCNVSLITESRGAYERYEESVEASGALKQSDHKGAQVVCYEKQVHESDGLIMVEMTSTKNTVIDNGVCPTLTARMGTGGNQVNAVCYESSPVYVVGNGQLNDAAFPQKELARTLSTMHDQQIVAIPDGNEYVLRRLTPLECERLQGFPDGWTDIEHKGKPMSDSARYRMLGNSVAVPCVEFIMKRIKEVADE